MNKYHTLYDRLIDSAKTLDVRGGHLHHILPRCLGGTDDPDNLVRLTERDHYTAHWCLWMMHKDCAEKGPKMAKAYRFMKALARLDDTITTVNELVEYGRKKGINVSVRHKFTTCLP